MATVREVVMPIVHDRDARSAFPFRAVRVQGWGMTSTSPERAVRRVAELQLRGSAGPLPARVGWPVLAPAAAPPALLVFHSGRRGDDPLCRALCARAGLVVLWTLRRVALGDAAGTVEWAADHAADLGADPGRVLVGGRGAGAGLAAAVALRARDEQWPVLARQVLVRPEFASAEVVGAAAGGVAGVAPATIVTDGGAGRAYAARLRRAGVTVDELRLGDEVPSARLAAELAAALTRGGDAA
jgi:acetyl esterase/lipase